MSDVLALAPGSSDLADAARHATSARKGLVVALDCAAPEPVDPWDEWVAGPSARLMLRVGDDVRGNRQGSLVTLVRLSAPAGGATTKWRSAVELAAVEAMRGVTGAIALERAGTGTVANTVVIDEHTSAHDVDRVLDYLLDPDLNGFTTGATLRLTQLGYPMPGVEDGGRRPGRALITGAAGTIGFATARAYAAAGYTPILCDLDAGRLAERAEELAGAETVQLDVTDRQQLRGLVRDGAFGTDLSALALVHGFQGSCELEELDERMIAQSMAVNGTSVFALIEELTPLLAAAAPSAIAVVSSQCGIRAEPVTAAYCAPKFALVGLAAGLAPALAQERININVLCPGPVDTAFLRAYFHRFAEAGGSDDIDAVVAERAAAMPVGRFARPQEMGEALRLLSQLDATGLLLAPTGGETLT